MSTFAWVAGVSQTAGGICHYTTGKRLEMIFMRFVDFISIISQ
ncbi:MAG: hypothetical protein RSI06_09935 [Lachnospiraceae bacterium]